MSAPGCTPGPWKVATGAPEFICSDDKWIGCTMGVRHCDEARANARQMAASSALYDALVIADRRISMMRAALGTIAKRNQADTLDSEQRDREAALASARGESQ